MRFTSRAPQFDTIIIILTQAYILSMLHILTLESMLACIQAANIEFSLGLRHLWPS